MPVSPAVRSTGENPQVNQTQVHQEKMHTTWDVHDDGQQNHHNIPTNLRDRVAQQAEHKTHKERKAK